MRFRKALVGATRDSEAMRDAVLGLTRRLVRAVELIERKRDGGTLTGEEIDHLVQGYTKGEIPDYQMSAFLMAVVLRGMDAKETADLTASMVASGERLDLSRFGPVVDKAPGISSRPAVSRSRR